MVRESLDFNEKAFLAEEKKRQYYSGFNSRKYRLSIYALLVITAGCSTGFFVIDVDQFRLQILSIWVTAVLTLVATYSGAQVVQKFKDVVSKKPSNSGEFEDGTDPEHTPL